MGTQDKKRKLIQIFNDTPEKMWNSADIAEILHVSVRTALRYMKDLRNDGLENGFYIRSIKGKGYSLKVTDEHKFKKYLQSDEIVKSIILQILLGETCRLNDLAEMFNYSRSGINLIINKARDEIETKGLKLLSKPYAGFIVCGNEMYIRNYMYELLAEEPLDYVKRIFKISEYSDKAVQKFLAETVASDSTENINTTLFIKQLYIWLYRVRSDKSICSDFVLCPYCSEEWVRDKDIAADIMEICGIDRNNVSNYDNEQVYLTLLYEQSFCKSGPASKSNDMEFYRRIVEKSLQRIKQDYMLDLQGDEILVNGLILHIASSYPKYLLGMETENYFHNDILKKYPTAYFYAMIVAEEITKYTKLPLKKHEVSFLGVPFAAYMERKEHNSRCNKYFRYFDGRMDKNEILNAVCDEYIESGLLMPDEKQQMFERESLASTEIFEGIAMPHVMIENESFLGFNLLEHWVTWGRTKVRLVILGCFMRGDIQMKNELKYIFEIMQESENREHLLSCKTIEELEGRINVYYESLHA